MFLCRRVLLWKRGSREVGSNEELVCFWLIQVVHRYSIQRHARKIKGRVFGMIIFLLVQV